MIQDMFDFEFYMGEYEVLDVNIKVIFMKFGKYKDIVECVVCIIGILIFKFNEIFFKYFV